MATSVVAAIVLTLTGNFAINLVPTDWAGPGVALTTWGLLVVLVVLVVVVEVLRSSAESSGLSPADYLARETWHRWSTEARVNGIKAPVPATVRWHWAPESLATQPSGSALSVRESLPTRGTVATLHDQLFVKLPRGEGKLVLIGGPGAGKTGAMMVLLLDILDHRRDAQPDDVVPVPVWLTLGGWNPDESGLLEWANHTMRRDYPGLNVAHNDLSAAGELLRSEQVALLLDGLDEMPEALQAKALDAIDHAATVNRLRVVLTSRREEYQRAVASGRLFGAVVVELEPMAPEDVASFLITEQLQDRLPLWRAVADKVRSEPESVAARTLNTPLALTMARDTYRTHADGDPCELLDEGAFPRPDALIQHLFSRFLHHAYPHERERMHAVRWLSWLARGLGDGNNLPWWTLTTFVPQWRLRATRAILLGSFTAFCYFPAYWALAQDGSLTRATTELFGRSEVDGDVLRDHPLLWGFAVALFAGLGMALMGVLLWRKPFAELPAATPETTHALDRRMSALAGLVAGLIVALMVGIGYVRGFGTEIALTTSLLAFLTFGLLFGVNAGPAPAVALADLTLTLNGNGRVRTVRILRQAHQRQILRQVGPIYQFRHAQLKEYLAGLDSSIPLERASRMPGSDR